MSKLKKQHGKQEQPQKRKGWRTWFSSGQKTASSAIEDQEMSPLIDSKTLVLCSSTDDVTLYDFISCIDGDLSSLVVTGEPTTEQLQDCWMEIVSQYNELIKSEDSAKFNELTCEIERLAMKISAVEHLVAGLQLGYQQELAEGLRLWDYDFPFSEKTLVKDLKRVMGQLGNDATHLAMAKSAYDAKKAQDGSISATNRATRADYNNILMIISRHDKVSPPYRAKALSTTEFALMYQQFSEYCKQMNKQTADV